MGAIAIRGADRESGERQSRARANTWKCRTDKGHVCSDAQLARIVSGFLMRDVVLEESPRGSVFVETQRSGLTGMRGTH